MITINGLNHSFKIGKKGKEKHIPVLRDVNFDVNQGEIVSIVGKSGSGKSTLLHILAGFMTPESGEIKVKGIETSTFNEADNAEFRLNNYGFIFQNFQLMPGLNAFENVELPLKLKGIEKAERKEKVENVNEICRPNRSSRPLSKRIVRRTATTGQYRTSAYHRSTNHLS